MKKLPIGIQNLREIIEEGYVYVDKTSFAHRLISTGKHYFLSRPRRFGKSLFVDTLAEIFRGNKDLFRNCAIAQTNYDWEPHPVLTLSFSRFDSKAPEGFKVGLTVFINRMARQYGVELEGNTPSLRFQVLIEELAKKCNSVVVLVDEYDYPIINNLNNPEVAAQNREELKNFFATLKDLDAYLKLTFVTGISRFSKVSLFSGGNNLKDLTMHAEYATLMGYTEEELHKDFAAHIQATAQARNLSEEAVLVDIKRWYNGYRFVEKATCVYNPFSTLNYLDEKKFKSYWYDTGTPSFLIKQIQQYPANLLPLSGTEVSANKLAAKSQVEHMELTTLMFQTGYLTITDYDEHDKAYRLAFPNLEVREAFLDSLLDELTSIDPLQVTRTAAQLRDAMNKLDMAAVVKMLNIHFAKISYHIHQAREQRLSEGFYQAVFFTFLERSGMDAKVEETTSRGRIDLVVQMPQYTFIFELKVDQPADVALDQIREQHYQERYLQADKQIVAIAISFSTKARNIGECKGGLYTAEGQLVRELNAGLQT